MSTKKTTEKFIEECKIIHSNFYDYSVTFYTNCKSKVKIICPVHGVFEQRALNHLSGRGCPKCGIEKSKSDPEKAIKKLIEKHGYSYDYSLVDYKGSHEKIKIICPIHGIFEQVYSNHLKGNRCGKCIPRQKKTTKEFIKEAKKVHGDIFDYSLVKYVKNNIKIKIICQKHGVFEQSPKEHLSGQSCKACHCERVNIGFNEYHYFTNYLKEINEEFISQYPVTLKYKNYYIDFYNPGLKIAIEYDEKEHKYKKESDNIRQKRDRKCS